MVIPREENVVKMNGLEGDKMLKDEPVSPTGQYFNSPALSVSILVVFESDVPIDDTPTWSTLENLFLPINPRFSSIMVRDENGAQQWRRVEVKLEDHVRIPVFPPGLESYDEHQSEYLSQISLEQFPQDKPLWNMHIIKYPTSKAEGTLVFKLHHALGDGFSLMAALFSCLRRASDPSLPLTFPSSKSQVSEEKTGGLRLVQRLSVCVNTVRDFGWSLWKSNFSADGVCAVRSGAEGVELLPMTLASVEYLLADIQRIKMKTGGTINDVICGILFYGIQLYLQAAEEKGTAEASNVTALVLLNTRVIGNYKPLNEMIKRDAESPWGNQFGFLHVGIPACKVARNANPLEFVHKARQIIKQKRSSLAMYFTAKLLEMLRRLIGPEGTAKYIHATLRNTSMTISNLTGPSEQIAIAGHPVRSFYFLVLGSPQSLTISVVSYTGKLKVVMGVEKGFINPNLLVSCMDESFERVFEAAVGEKPHRAMTATET